MEYQMVVATYIAALAAVFGPLAAVAGAHILARQDSKRTAAASVFQRAMENILRFRHAMYFAYSLMRDSQKARAAYVELTNSLALYSIEEHQATLDRALSKSQMAEERHLRAMRDVVEFDAALNADALALRLLFDSAASECVTLIEELRGLQFQLNSEQERSDIDLADFDFAMGSVLRDFGEEISRLNRSLRDPSTWDA